MANGKNANTVVLLMSRVDENAKLVITLLEKAAFTVFHCEQRAEILAYCRAECDSVQLAIIDTATAGADTSELLVDLQAVNPRIPVLLIAGEGGPQPAESWSSAPNVWGQLSRPFRRAQFLGSVLDAAREPLVRTA